MTGVERWTAEVIRRLMVLGPERYVVAQPRPRVRERALAQSWEQLALPAQAARLGAALVFSPANLAPLAWPRNVVVVHDAAVLREPAAYSRAYRLWHERVGLAAARRAIAVIAVSQFTRRELIELAGLYAGARAFVLPSRYEGFGLTCLEAMACGTPVVAANRAALPETCGAAALLVDPDDPAALADAVVTAARGDAVRRQLRSAGLRRAAQFTWDRTATQVDALLSELARVR